jgi:phosphoribosylformylglycinamidine synthase subunit PurQ / glutaminase
MKVAIIRFPGSNCDQDVFSASERVGGTPRYCWHRDTDLGDVDAVMLPGGFSYGDYLRAGAIATMSPIMESVKAFADAGGPVLGICNGFQMLCEAGLLPGALLRNDTLRFSSRDVYVRVDRSDTMYTADYTVGDVLRIPIAHADGNYYADAETLERIQGEGRIVLRYCDARGEVGDDANPNGSAAGIAGMVNTQGNVLGMMPHPERAMDEVLGSTDGLGFFTALASHLMPA